MHTTLHSLCSIFLPHQRDLVPVERPDCKKVAVKSGKNIEEAEVIMVASTTWNFFFFSPVISVVFCFQESLTGLLVLLIQKRHFLDAHPHCLAAPHPAEGLHLRHCLSLMKKTNVEAFSFLFKKWRSLFQSEIWFSDKERTVCWKCDTHRKLSQDLLVSNRARGIVFFRRIAFLRTCNKFKRGFDRSSVRRLATNTHKLHRTEAVMAMATDVVWTSPLKITIPSIQFLTETQSVRMCSVILRGPASTENMSSFLIVLHR